MSSIEDCILFEQFVKLLNSISKVQPRRAGLIPDRNKIPKSVDLVNHWFTRVREYGSAIPPNTGRIFFRLFFPEEDVRRRYNLKETALARTLATDVFGLSSGTNEAGLVLTQWPDYPESRDQAKLGCLGVEVEKVLSERHSIRQGKSPSIQRIDSLLDELASLSGYSCLGTFVPPHTSRRARAAILRDLFLDLEPLEAKFLTQIILKDLRPVLYPLKETNTTMALLQYKSNALHILTKWEVMRAWHPCMPKIYRARATLDEAASAVEGLSSTTPRPQDEEVFLPIMGVPVDIPKSQKGVKLSHALSFFEDTGDVWAETKYDGERMQIHVDLSQSVSQQITIFSKSKRNSTQDRAGTHPIIRAALGLPPCPHDYLQYPILRERASGFQACTHKSLILDAEMVSYSESKLDIDEFWRIRGLIESTAHGVRGAKYHNKRNARPPESLDSQESGYEESQGTLGGSLASNASDNGDRHLKLVLFDVLFVDGFSLLDLAYVERRARLVQLVNIIPGFVSLSTRHRISLSRGLPSATKDLAQVFSEHIADRQEGLVLKGAASRYNSHQQPWVKLKRDYIPGYGDTIDLAIVGAGWNKERARELRVAPETLTTFFVAALEKPRPGSDIMNCTPQFQVLFTVEYGMSREQLETFNLYIKTSEPRAFSEKSLGLSYQFKLPQGLIKPVFMLSRPLLAELFGAGFTKEAGAKYYSLRFPRITKVWRANERTWAQGNHLEDFQSIARSSIGRESSDEWASRNVEAMWGCEANPGPKDPRSLSEATRMWQERLLQLEPTSVVKQNRTISCSSKRKAPSQDIQEPSHKRRKLSAGRAAALPLKALGSMTNFMRTDSRTQRLTARPHSLPITPVLLSREAVNQQNKKHDNGISNIKVASHHAPITPISADRTHVCSSGTIASPSVPSLQSTHCPSDSARAHTSMTSNDIPMAMPSVHCPSVYDPITPATSVPPTSPMAMPSVHCPSVYDPITPATSVPPTSPTQGPSSETNYSIHRFPDPYWPQDYIHTRMVQFLQDAYVWIATDPENKRPTNRPPALQLVPQNRRIAVIRFLLIICGCKINDTQRRVQRFPHVNKSVMFIRTSSGPADQEAQDWLFGALETWRAELNRPGNKELFVFNSDMITYQSLATFEGDVASQALWRSSREPLHVI